MMKSYREQIIIINFYVLLTWHIRQVKTIPVCMLD
jgi:hypothetical protein